MSLNGKVTIVTGSATGIGRVIAREFARSGASVVVNDYQGYRGAENLVKEIRKDGGTAIAVRADVSQRQDVDCMLKAAVDAFGQVDVLVNNAAFDESAHFLQINEDLWDRTIETNLKGAFLCSQAAAREMVKGGKGRIINISSVHGLATSPNTSHYAASKGGLNALTRGMALDLAPYRITVNAVSPGLIEVERFHDGDWYDRAQAADRIPVRRVGFPIDIAKMVMFLASDDVDYITGQIVTVDGGTSALLAGALKQPPRG